MWLSLVERYVRDVEVASSNLVISTIKTKERHRLSFVFMMRCSSSPWLRSNCKFAYPVRRSPSSLGRRRTWVSRSVATLPCHLDKNNILSYVYDRTRTQTLPCHLDQSKRAPFGCPFYFYVSEDQLSSFI